MTNYLDVEAWAIGLTVTITTINNCLHGEADLILTQMSRISGLEKDQILKVKQRNRWP